MPTANEQLFDAAVRNQVFLQRFGGTVARRIVRLLSEADRDVLAQLQARIERLGPVDRQEVGAGLVSSRRLERLLDAIRQQNLDLRAAIRTDLTGELVGLANLEAAQTAGRISEAIGVDLGDLRPAPELLRAAVTAEPFRGRVLRDWVGDLAGKRLQDIHSEIRLGLVEGQTTPQIVRRVRDIAGVTHRRAEMLSRTAVNHIGNRARELTYLANDDVVKGLRWTSTLDGRTSAICRARDGRIYALNSGPRPPAHLRCRSLMTPVTKSWRELQNTRLKDGRGSRDMDRLFREKLRARGLSDSQIASTIRNARASINGQVPGDLSYGDWLKRQPAAFQNEVLGEAKGALFRRGGLGMDKFVDMRSGRELSLDELRSRYSEAWMKAGLDDAA